MRAMGFSLALAGLLAACAPQESEPPAATPEPGPQIQTEEVEYSASDDGVTMEGFVAWDASQSGRRPGVLVVHEWWGHDDYARRRARMLAELGYTALAVDMYGEGKQADHPEDAQQLSSGVMENLDTAQARFEAALELLKSRPTTDPDKIAAIGYCFGGGVVLHMARAGMDLDGVVSFHGSLAAQEKAEPGEVEAEILVLHGGDDPFVTQEQLEAFEAEMDAAGADYEVIVYEGAKHSFTSPQADERGERFDLPLAYDEAADEQSWQAMQDFFQRIFRDAPADQPAGEVEEETGE